MRILFVMIFAMSLPERLSKEIKTGEETLFSARQRLLFEVITRKPFNDFMWYLAQAERNNKTDDASHTLFHFPENLHQTLKDLPIDSAFPEYRNQKLLRDARKLYMRATNALINVQGEYHRKKYVQKKSLWRVNSAVRGLYQHLEYMFPVQECEEFIAYALHDIYGWCREAKQYLPAQLVGGAEAYQGLFTAAYRRLEYRKKHPENEQEKFTGNVYDAVIKGERSLR